LAILFRLSNTFQLIANTQRELRRAIHQLGEHRSAEPGINNAGIGPESALASRPGHLSGDTKSFMGSDDLASLSL
jgi:hypothetical protein